MRRKPYSVILFDEAEKAHPDVFNLMLQMFDDGRLTDGQGKLIDFKNTVIILTSNIASDIILDETLSNEEKHTEIQRALKEKFKPEFLNRIDEVIMFKSLTKNELKPIVDIQTNTLKKRLGEQDISFEISESAKDFLANEGYEPLYGARPLKRYIQKYVETLSAKLILGGDVHPRDTIVIDADENGLTAYIK